jgi:hypothetical protein
VYEKQDMEVATVFYFGSLKGGHLCGDLSLVGGNVFIENRRRTMGFEVVDKMEPNNCIVRVLWWAFVNTAMNCWVLQVQ